MQSAKSGGSTVSSPSSKDGFSLEIENVSKSFGRPVLRDVSASIHPGGVVALLGANGAGKTTLFNLINGLLRPDSGHVRLGGIALTRLAPSAVARLGVARLFQNLRVFDSMTALENMLVGEQVKGESLALGGATRRARVSKKDATEKAVDLLERVGLAERIAVPALDLSYGQRKRLALARALMCDPRLLLLDEPSSGIDARNLTELLDVIRDATSPDRVVLLIEHNRRVVQDLADRVLFLHDGAVIKDGSVDDVFNDAVVANHYLGS